MAHLIPIVAPLPALGLAASLWFLLSRTRWGYVIRVIGASPGAARYAGFSISRAVVWIFLISGGLAGLGGASEVAGIHHRLQQGLAVGYGYAGIIVAWVAGLHPAAIVGVSILLGALLVGADQVQIVFQVPAAFGSTLQALVLFSLLAAQAFLRYRIVIRRGMSWRPPRSF